MSNFGFELALKKIGVPFARASVGDRYVIELMRQNGWRLGGENSGHIVCSNVTTTGDGIISALQVLLAIITFGESLNKIKKSMSKMPQVMVNVHMGKRVDLSADEKVQSAVNAAELILAGTGRVLLRTSGTEPVVRVMVEGEDRNLVKELAQELARVVELALN
jgi:phosphoglucosamine mutase